VGLDRQVVLRLLFVELETVLEARTATALDIDPQLQGRIAFVRDQFADLGGGGRGEIERPRQRLVGIHPASMGRAAPLFNRNRVQSRCCGLAVATSQLKDCSTRAPRAGSSDTVTRSGCSPCGSTMFPSTC